MIILEPWRQTKNVSFHRAVFKQRGRGPGGLVRAGQQLLITTATVGPLLSHRWGVTCGGWAPPAPPTLGCVQLNLWSWWDEEVCLTHKSQQQQTLLGRYWEVCHEVGQREAGQGRAGWPSPKPRLSSGGATVAPPMRLLSVCSLFA